VQPPQCLVQLDQLVLQERQVLQEVLALLVLLDQQEQQVPQDLPVQQVQLVPLVLLEPLEPQVQLVLMQQRCQEYFYSAVCRIEQ
jgi:hypothetical protein